MALQLNEPVQVYKEFYGRNVDQMPKLVGEGRAPLSVAGLMKRRLEVVDSPFEGLESAWIYNYFDTGDAIYRHNEGRCKVVLDDKALRSLNPKSKLLNGGLALTEKAYDQGEGNVFSEKDLEKYTGRALKITEVQDNPIWLDLARGDQHLLKEYAAMIFAKAKKTYGYNENMGLYLPSTQEQPIMRSWYVGGLYGRSDAGGNCDLGNGDGRFVGVAPEALVAKNLEGKVGKK